MPAGPGVRPSTGWQTSEGSPVTATNPAVTVAPRARVRYLDRWDDALLSLVVVPLVLWGAVSVFMLARACNIDAYVAWIPAVATTGVMLTTTRMAMRHGMPAEIKRWATYLAAFAVFTEIIVAGLQHSLPATLQPPAIVMFVIGCLPTLMGAATIKVWAAAHAAQDDANAAIEQAALDAQAAQAAALAQVEVQRQLAAEQAIADENRRTAEIAHAQRLAALAEQAADAETRRKRVEKAVPPQRPHLVPPPQDGPTTDALGRPAAPSPKRDAALAWLVDQHRAGRDLDSITGAEVDRAIKANAYARKHLKTWITDVRAYVAKGAA